MLLVCRPGVSLKILNFLKDGQRRNSRTHEHTTRITHGGGSCLAARRSQPSSLAVSRLTVNAVKDLNGGAIRVLAVLHACMRACGFGLCVPVCVYGVCFVSVRDV